MTGASARAGRLVRAAAVGLVGGGRVIVCVGVVAVVLTGCSRGGDETDGAGASPLLSADQVDARESGRGTQLLEPATDTCPVDGPWLWSKASDADVRGFTRQVDGTRESIVVGAWPMSEASAETALERIGPDPGCRSDGVIAESVSIGSVGSIDARSFEVRERDAAGNLVSWKVRGYTWAEGHLVTVWSEREGSQPSLDEVRELMLEQATRLDRT